MPCCKPKVNKVDGYYEDESNDCEKGEKGGACWWSPLFIIDYAVAIVLLVFSLIMKVTVEPYHMLSPKINITVAVLDSHDVPHNEELTIDIDQDRQYPAVDEALPTVVAGILFAAVCIATVVMSQIIFRLLVRHKWNILHDLHNFVLGVLESIALELFFCNILKPFAGRYRPRYLELAAAAENERDEWEGRVSYPSGHSGTAFATMFLCTLYLLGKTRSFSVSGRFGGGAAGRFGYVVFSLLPTLGAFLIAVTRTRDYMHNFSDINAGAIIGILCSTVAYFTVYPSLKDENCHLPRIRLIKPAKPAEPAKKDTRKNDDDDAVEVVVNVDEDVDEAVSSKRKY